MKQLFFATAICLASSIAAQAQNSPQERHSRAMKDFPPRIGIKAGFNSANLTIDNAGNVNDKRAIPSWHAGLFADLPLLPVLSLQPGVFLTGKGAKFTLGDNESNNYSEVSTRPMYLEVPVNLVVKLPLPNKVKVFAGAGPYGAYGIGGKNKIDGKLLGVSFADEDNIEWSNDDPKNGNNGNAYNGDLKRFDFGLNIMAGLEISHFVLNANYGYGLVNIRPGADNDNSKYQNRVASVSVGVML